MVVILKEACRLITVKYVGRSSAVVDFYDLYCEMFMFIVIRSTCFALEHITITGESQIEVH